MKTISQPLIVAIVTAILALAVSESALTFVAGGNAGREVDVSAELNGSLSSRTGVLEMSFVRHKGLYYCIQYKVFGLFSISLSNMPGAGSSQRPGRTN